MSRCGAAGLTARGSLFPGWERVWTKRPSPVAKDKLCSLACEAWMLAGTLRPGPGCGHQSRLTDVQGYCRKLWSSLPVDSVGHVGWVGSSPDKLSWPCRQKAVSAPSTVESAPTTSPWSQPGISSTSHGLPCATGTHSLRYALPASIPGVVVQAQTLSLGVSPRASAGPPRKALTWDRVGAGAASRGGGCPFCLKSP